MDPAPPPVSPHEGDTGRQGPLPDPWAEAKAKAPPPPAPSGTRSSTTVPSHVVPIMPGRTDLHAASTPIMTSSTLRDHPPSRAPPTIDEHGGAGPGTMDPIDERHAAGPNAGPNQPPASRLAPPARTSRSREFMGGGASLWGPHPSGRPRHPSRVELATSRPRKGSRPMAVDPPRRNGFYGPTSQWLDVAIPHQLQ